MILLLACSGSVDTERVSPPPSELRAHCDDAIGPKRVEQLTERVHVAIGYDLANTIVVTTDHGNIVIDAMSRPDRAAEARAALPAGPTLALVLTHSHADHVGGASAWVDEGTQVWATDAFQDHFLKQYGLFREVEQLRGGRQHGAHLDDAELPCSSIGPRLDFSEGLGSGVRMPTHTFGGRQELEIGGVRLVLVEAHGETDDQLFVWLPDEGVLLPGDNFYRAFPNLYTIRGTRRRPVDSWIASLDAMRALEPAWLVPSHTRPVEGADEVQVALRDYRDAISWVRDAVVRGANAGLGPDDVDATLPGHLARSPYLVELYGELEWSARGIYTSELGWFDGSGGGLNPPPDLVERQVAMMGGPEAVLEEARGTDDPRWALHLLGLVDQVDPELLRRRAAEVANTNERAYLLELAWEAENGTPRPQVPPLDDAFLEALPTHIFFEQMAARIDAPAAAEVHETLLVDLADSRWYVTQRRGVVEVSEGSPLPGTPEPFATLRTDPLTWKRLALGQQSTLEAVASGALVIDGNPLAVGAFTDRFVR